MLLNAFMRTVLVDGIFGHGHVTDLTRTHTRARINIYALNQNIARLPHDEYLHSEFVSFREMFYFSTFQSTFDSDAQQQRTHVIRSIFAHTPAGHSM